MDYSQRNGQREIEWNMIQQVVETEEIFQLPSDYKEQEKNKKQELIESTEEGEESLGPFETFFPNGILDRTRIELFLQMWQHQPLLDFGTIEMNIKIWETECEQNNQMLI